ncbi:MAG TPA: copper amine oxidase N-terminal domain-containing protein [Pseudobacteroides sp.]|uniref:copper amine oxidase N-terminal domain-containing protein n=1 Tax=Pseudobacteroides sp. TaxID=1968840 RepID=UPI002F95E248
MKKVIMIVLILLIIINPAYNIPAYGVLVEEKPTDKNSLLQNTDATGPLVKTHLQNQNNNAISIESNTSPLQTFWVSNDCFLRKVEVEIYWKHEAKSTSTGDLILDIVEVGSSKFKVISSKVKSKNDIPKNRSMDGKYQITSFQFDPGVPFKADTTHGIRFRSPDCEPIDPMETGYEWSFFGYSSPLGDKYENGELLSNFDGENYEEVHGDGVFSIYVSKGISVLNTGKPYMTVNGVKKDIENGKHVSPVIKDGRTLIPIKALIEQLGGSVTWSGSEKKISINLNSKLIELWINSNTVSINGVKKKSDSSPSIINSRTFVPLRLIAESLGCKVNWNPKEKNITLEYGNLDDITINPVPAPTPTINSKKVNVNFNDLYNTNDFRLNWYEEDRPVPAEVGYNIDWLKSRGLRLTCYPNVSTRMTYLAVPME